MAAVSDVLPSPVVVCANSGPVPGVAGFTCGTPLTSVYLSSDIKNFSAGSRGIPRTLVSAAGCLATYVFVTQQRRKGRWMASARSVFPAKTRCQYSHEDSESRTVTKPKAPKNLYELLKVKPTASQDDIKKAYYNLQKVCHPDVAGDAGSDMCILLNDAYDVLSDSKKRRAYDANLDIEQPLPRVEVSSDLGPTWQFNHQRRKQQPQWTGRPFS
eukprot:5946023-Amphidinium_carterae.1